MRNNATRTETYKNHKIELFIDENAESPREWDNLGTMVCFHRSYELGDKHKYTVEEIKDLLDRKDVLALPLYLYDHSGITISTKPFSCPWDSGQVGIVFVEYSKIKEEYSVKRISPKIRERARKCLIGEVETYDTFLRGEVLGYVVDDDGDSCWGYYSEEDAISEARSVIDWTIKESVKKHAEKLKVYIKNHVPLEKRECLTV